jgi:N-acetylglucosamine-6-sulfatase
MTTSDAPSARRLLATVTAAVTALAILAGVVLLASVTSPSAAQTAASQAPAAAANASAVAFGAQAPADAAPTPSPEATTSAVAGRGSLPGIRNVVLVLADDLDWALFNQVPRLAALQDEGMTFTNQTVTDSLCCPSRTSILRSQYLHNHGVVSNLARTGGGWPTFEARGEQNDCLPVWLNNAGIKTALFGKYLNDYPASPKEARLVPPGWSDWAVPISRGDSYSGYNYTLNDNGKLRKYGNKPTDFLNDVITNKATEFIRTAPDGFFLELSTYNPHNPSPVALRNKGTHATTVAPRYANYNAYGTNEPSWLRAIGPMSAARLGNMDQLWRKRAQSAESVADSVDAVRATLAATGHTDDTLIIVTSDNGYHAGSHRLSKGKRTAFHEDTVVPMVVLGPGVTPGARVDAMTSTVDLGPTISAALGATAPTWVDGRSLTDIIGSGGQVPATWRNAVLTESMGTSGPGDPDFQKEAPPQFGAMRTQDYLFVVYRNGERELYDLRTDHDEMHNIASTADPALVAGLNSQLQALRACAGDTCRTADSIVVPTATTAAPATSS